MKSIFIFSSAIIIIVLSGCIRHQENFFQSKNEKKIIALQPLGNYDTKQLNFISQEISSFFSSKVIILKPVTIPASYQLIKDAEIYTDIKHSDHCPVYVEIEIEYIIN